jgi:N-acetylglucosaminyl-diphospho-decaprenol L-rhamnosyltransferase
VNFKQDISILVVTHNHAEFIEKLIHSLEQFNYTNVFFCDANSSDDSLNIIQNSSFSNNILHKTTLEGFSKNNNDLIRHFRLNSKYYLLLNPDLYFDEDFIFKLYQVIEKDSSTGIVTPLIYYPNKTIQTTWKKYPSVFHVLKKRAGFIKSDEEIQMSSGEIDWCLGACMLISKTLLKNNGTLLDDRYRLYCEDVDICFEAKQKNLKVIGVSEAHAYHHLGNKNTKFIFSKYNFWNIKSIIQFALKWNVKYYAR